jgi:hypothetical protein
MTSRHRQTPAHAPSQGLSRRAVMRSGGAMAGAAALLAGGSQALNAHQSTDTLELDVAIDGRTWRSNRLSEVGPPLRGDTFIVFGSVFAGGSLDEEDVAGPDDPGAIGRWICQGTFLVDVASG